jgi:hypothetical protein
LQTKGTSTCSPSDYKLTYNDDFGITFLNYSSPFDIWPNQTDWAASLNTPAVLTYHLNSGVTVFALLNAMPTHPPEIHLWLFFISQNKKVILNAQ